MALETLPATAPRLARPAIGSATLSVVVALYLLFVTNGTFWAKAVTYLGLPSFGLILLCIGLAALFSALCIAVSVKYLTKPLFILLITSAATASSFMDRYGTIIDLDMIRNAAKTTGSEAGHLMTAGFLTHMTVFALVPSLLIALVRIRHRPIAQKVLWNLAVILPCLAVFAAAAIANVRTFAATTRQHRDLVATLNPVMPIASTLRYLNASGAEKNIVVQPLGTDAHVIAPAVSGKPRVVIIVAGETARADDFSLGGYSRLTNPELSRRLAWLHLHAPSTCSTEVLP